MSKFVLYKSKKAVGNDGYNIRALEQLGTQAFSRASINSKSLPDRMNFLELPAKKEQRFWLKRITVPAEQRATILAHQTREAKPVFLVIESFRDLFNASRLIGSFRLKTQAKASCRERPGRKILQFFLRDVEPQYFTCDLKETWDDLWEMEA